MINASNIARGRTLNPAAVAFVKEQRGLSLKAIKTKLDAEGVGEFTQRECKLARTLTGRWDFWNYPFVVEEEATEPPTEEENEHSVDTI